MTNPGGWLILELDNLYMNEFTFQWIYCGQPCQLIFRKPQRAGATGVMVENNSDEVDHFIERVKYKAHVIVHQLPK